jgi:hypothetical protein
MLELIKDSGLKPLKDHTIWVLHLTITLRVWHWGIIDFNARVCTKVFELRRSKLSPTIGDDIIGYAKLVHDLFYEFDRLAHCDWGGRIYLDPLHKFIHCNEDMFESSFSFLEWTNQI